MIALLFLLFVFLHGLVIANITISTKKSVKFAGGFILGSLLSVSFVYWVACLLKSLDLSLLLFFFFSIQFVLIFKKNYQQTLQLFAKPDKLAIAIGSALFLFSYYLFAKTFGYDSIHGNFLVASNVYLDFGAHIPFIRSFSLGNNFPGEVPFFQNTGLLYYFLFDFYGGVIEHLGLQINVAYNLISAISFTCLLSLTYQLTLTIFKRKTIAILSVVFFLFSGNLSFLTFFQKNGLSLHTFFAWWHNGFYLEGLPTLLDKTIAVAGFWNLNPYMNQRHLVFGVAFFLLFLFIFLEKKNKIQKVSLVIMGLSLGFLTMWHTMVFLALCMIAPVLFWVVKEKRKEIIFVYVLGCIVALPQLLLIKLHSANTILLIPGFLLEKHITLTNEFVFWLINLGIGLLTIPMGFYFANNEEKKLFYIFLPLFVIPNLVHLSSRFTFDDHKYFNVWIIGANMFSAFFVAKLITKNVINKIIAIFLIILLTLSGIISIMVIKNDIFTALPDYPKNALLTTIIKYIPNNAVILSNGEIYDPATLVGKKTFIGRVQYIFVYGGNASKRLEIQQKILQPLSRENMIQTVHNNHIQYIILYKNNFAKNEKPFERKFLDTSFTKLYEDTDGIIYKI